MKKLLEMMKLVQVLEEVKDNRLFSLEKMGIFMRKMSEMVKTLPKTRLLEFSLQEKAQIIHKAALEHLLSKLKDFLLNLDKNM